ncbi:L,D-transpeptidase [Rhizohabitans arisaemae]|uniref:L,D-transpeptidase n=1 Tax=Rhizohabitans arisaemae TaxID=2720610 RepID=UPI0024B225C2|nr:Ig-like domain-containing protein [Rhizohabitans arisaemae]
MTRGGVLAGVFGVAVLLLAGCQETSGQRGAAGPAPTQVPAAKVEITPVDGTAAAKPEQGVVVRVVGGGLETVDVRAAGKKVPGEFNGDRTEWRADRNLVPSARYTVTATAKNGAGTVTTAKSGFRALKPASTVKVADVTPGIRGEKVGVGMPIMVRFSAPVRDRAAVERALRVDAEKPVEGAWRWIDPKLVIYRTKTYWPAHQKVTFQANLAGVKAGANTYGIEDFEHKFEIGAAQITTVNTRTFHMTVKRDGKQLKRIPISAGKATTREYTTTSGVHLTMSRENPVVMTSPGRKPGDPEYYKLTVNHAIRISNSGEYVHALGNTWAQGRRNVSHGCINVAPATAAWYYNMTQRGDVVVITGTDRELEWDNGWGYWQIPWKKWANADS